MPELPEAERARQQIERVLGRRIADADDRDGYVCRPHAPGEIADALRGRALTAAHRRGKFLWVETDDPRGPYGAKGLGEMGLVPTAAAIANAVYDATGARIPRIPLVPERVLTAIDEVRSNGGS